MKIIYESNTIRKVVDNDTDLADLRFYLPADEDKIYMAKFNFQLVPLKETTELHSKYKIFKLANISNAFSATEISVVCISSDFQNVTMSNILPIDTANQKYIAENTALSSAVVSHNIQGMYEKIIEMTKLNVKIHKEIKEDSNE